MILRNYTPFPHILFQSRNEQKQDFGVIVLRGSFEIIDGSPLKPLEEQEPLVVADQYFTEAGMSSMRMETNLAPYKPKSDIHINAVAHAPQGQPRLAWRVDVEFGKINKTLGVTGPRFWQKSLGSWKLLDPLPVAQVPIRYEQAFGGVKGQGEDVEVYAPNPVGMGFVGPDVLAGDEPIPAPNILPIDGYNPEINSPLKVEGLGPLAPAWQPRLGFAGTFDAEWERQRWPELPADFRFDFYNCAHPDLVYPGFLDGDEAACLTGLSPSGTLRFSLPDYLVGMLYRFEDGELVPAAMQLDTVHLELPMMRAYLTWRGLYPLARPLRVLEARMRPEASALRRRTAEQR